LRSIRVKQAGNHINSDPIASFPYGGDPMVGALQAITGKSLNTVPSVRSGDAIINGQFDIQHQLNMNIIMALLITFLAQNLSDYLIFQMI
jgi:hypothetical protein